MLCMWRSFDWTQQECVCVCSPSLSGALVNESCCTASLKLCCHLCFFDEHKPLPGSGLLGHGREATVCVCVWMRRSCDLWLVFTVDLCSYRSLCIASALSGYRSPVTLNTDKIIRIDYVLLSYPTWSTCARWKQPATCSCWFFILPLIKKLMGLGYKLTRLPYRWWSRQRWQRNNR